MPLRYRRLLAQRHAYPAADRLHVFPNPVRDKRNTCRREWAGCLCRNQWCRRHASRTMLSLLLAGEM